MRDLTKGNETKLIVRFALPMLAGNVFQNLYNIVDSVIVGNYLGKEALAAVGASFPVIFTLIALVIGVGSGASIVISQFFGAKKTDEVRRTIDTIFIFFIGAAIILAALGIVFSESIFRLLQLPEEILPLAQTYLHIYLIGLFAFFGFNGIASILRGLGDSKTPLYFMIIATLANIVLDLLFVIVFKWGVGGVAMATVISQAGAFITAIFYLNRTHTLVKITLTHLQFDKSIFKSCVRIGLPTGFQQSFVAVGAMAIMGIVNGFGTNAVAAYTVALRIDSLAKMPAMNFASALSSFVGQNLGANEEQRARNGFRSTMVISVIYSIIISLLIIFLGEFLMRMFTDDPAVIHIGENYLVIVSSFYLAFAAMFSVIGMLRGAGDTLIPMYITVVTLWVIRLPLSWFLSRGPLGVTGIWWAIPIAWVVGAIGSYIYYLSGRWRGKTVFQHKDFSVNQPVPKPAAKQ
ncbi:MATE family efflux transporter [Prolixibacter bellariivorans]|uniref:Multidrug-efflux transporter n=1 Tax=Prolixibacter bellariivorans TaxID=314319 RepID=A0A5M4AWN3_9BACT|nr:MATE family efflux transporter [Prolixibacter bellariivorans]GET31991.1 MATE family efflux transporter [Prolixibacter bellariivorans]